VVYNSGVLSIEDYRALVAHKPNLIQYLLGGPKVEGFEIEPSTDTGRDVDL
jgi:antitoxin Phd